MRTELRRTSSLTDDEIRALWRFRLSLIDLKPTVSEERDYAAFYDDLRWDGWVWMVKDRGEVAGFFVQRGVRLTFEDRELVCLLPEYGFTAPHLRGGAAVGLGAAAITGLTRLSFGRPGLPTWIAASTYPPGYIAFRKVIRPFWTLGSPDLPAFERRLLLHLGERVSGASFCPDDGTVTMRTLPRAGVVPRSAEGQRLFAAYEAENPDWRAGRGLFFLFPVTVATLARTVLRRR